MGQITLKHPTEKGVRVVCGSKAEADRMKARWVAEEDAARAAASAPEEIAEQPTEPAS